MEPLEKDEVLRLAAERWLAGPRPIIIEPEGYKHNLMMKAFVDSYVSGVLGFEVDDVRRVVIGERNLWVWELLRNEDGNFFKTESGTAARRVHRFTFDG